MDFIAHKKFLTTNYFQATVYSYCQYCLTNKVYSISYMYNYLPIICAGFDTLRDYLSHKHLQVHILCILFSFHSHNDNKYYGVHSWHVYTSHMTTRSCDHKHTHMVKQYACTKSYDLEVTWSRSHTHAQWRSTNNSCTQHIVKEAS